MKNNFGWTGTLLRIELPSGTATRCRTSDYGDDFIGGRALASRIYWDEVSEATGALSPENVLMIMPGPLAGTPATACSRWVMAAKSPYYYPDQYSFGNCGGFFGAAIKFAGYDGLIIKGKAKTLSYLLIENDRVELRDATGLRGLASDDTLAKLQAAHGGNEKLQPPLRQRRAQEDCLQRQPLGRKPVERRKRRNGNTAREEGDGG